MAIQQRTEAHDAVQDDGAQRKHGVDGTRNHSAETPEFQ
jgi:hypothetical protein